MAHLWQHHYGRLSRSGYHSAEWAAKMQTIGFMPSDTGQPGGKITGQRMTHYIDEGGKFSQYCEERLSKDFVIPFVELWGETAKGGKTKSKSKFICVTCGAAAWGKPDLRIICAECDEVLEVDL